MFTRAYLRASTQDQDAKRAENELKKFAAERDWKIAATYIENESGATLKRPELFRLLADSQPGDILLVEQIDRLTRLNLEDWDRLRNDITAKQVLIVSLDLPTSWTMMAVKRDDVQARIFQAINNMMLDVLAAIARKDYEDRRRRQSQGIAKAKEAGAYRGRPEDAKRNDAIMAMLRRGQTWESIRHATRCSNSTIARLAKRVKTSEGA
ncbi:recombinase family protein [Rhizobium leguminosarum]|uniref:recombinase family protein n=1 Tax=Rhizobium leguminosarum TaxID=384 RepID=UPI00102FECDE|nr:recombinase family protein [Rhizobium leguminosarum]TBG92667.1 resolvase [Rhizobium leguminosarum]